MEKTEMQDRQKTVVAFVAGLLIGGLLVWVFSSTGEKVPANDQAAVENNNVAMNDTSVTPSTTGNTTTKSTPENMAPSTGTHTDTMTTGSFSIADQTAGTSVTLGKISYPTANGWIVVRDYENGSAGNILGAARYETGVGLTPQSIELLRATASGKTYQVVFFNDNGDKVFDKATDAEIDGASAVFTAK